MSIMRLTIRMAVVLPHPEGPTRTQMSPAGTSRERRVHRRLGRHPGSAWSRARNSRGSAGDADGPSDWAVSGAVTEDPWAGEGRAYRPSTQTGRSASLRMRRVLQRVVERLRAAWPVHAAISQSANHAFLGSSGPCRYVPITPSRTTPSKPDSPVLPCPRSTRPSGRSPDPEVGAPAVVLEAGQDACGPRRAPPRWRRCRRGACQSTRTVRRSTSPRPGISSSPSCVGVAEKLEAAADRRARAAPPSAAACSASRLVSTRSCAHSAWSRS